VLSIKLGGLAEKMGEVRDVVGLLLKAEVRVGWEDF